MPVHITWLCTPPSEQVHPGRRRAIEEICNDAARRNGWTAVGIRHPDHSTTGIPTRRGRGRVYVRSDPSVTVYVGYQSPINKYNAVGQGHFYIHYDRATRLPTRLAAVRELRIVRTGVNPEIWDCRTNQLMQTRGV